MASLTRIRAACGLALFLAAGGSALAQPLNIQSEFLLDRRERPEGTITFCLNPHSIQVDFDRAVGETLAEILLLEARFVDIVPELVISFDHLITLDPQELYIHLHNECDALLGYAMPPTELPDWLTITRPYYETRFVFLTDDPELANLGDVPPGEAIGSRIGSPGDGALLRYTLAQGENERWQRLPYNGYERLLERTFDGTLAGSVIWEPAIGAAVERGMIDPGAARIVPADPVPEATLGFALVLLAENSFLRMLLDDAIAAFAAGEDAGRLMLELGHIGIVPDVMP